MDLMEVPYSRLGHVKVADHQTLHAQPDPQLVAEEFVHLNLHLRKHGKV
jgi:hypothetical protein